MIPRLSQQCVSFRKKTRTTESQIQGRMRFPASGRINVIGLEQHRDACESCREWLSTYMFPYKIFERRALERTLSTFVKVHDISERRLIELLRIWQDHRRELKARPYGKKLEASLAMFGSLTEISKSELRSLIVDWLEEKDHQ